MKTTILTAQLQIQYYWSGGKATISDNDRNALTALFASLRGEYTWSPATMVDDLLGIIKRQDEHWTFTVNDYALEFISPMESILSL